MVLAKGGSMEDFHTIMTCRRNVVRWKSQGKTEDEYNPLNHDIHVLKLYSEHFGWEPHFLVPIVVTLSN